MYKRQEPELYGIYKKDENGNELKDANGNRILDEEGDYSGYFRDIQWKNKAITELYYPGSVFKVITLAMGVDSGLANINTTFTCAGAYGVAKETYHCAGHKAHGTIALAEALRQSCNIYYIQLGQRVGSQTFYNYFDAFGFTSRTGVDLPSETGFMQYYKANQLGEVQLASSAFGQAMAITPLQMCTAVAAAVNGGYLVTPHVVDKITDANGNVIEEIGANVRRQVISESTSNVIRQIMEYEVGAGTGGGKYAYVSGYRIGGKSGTSEQLNMDRRADGDYKKVASFAAVLPADDPEIIVYVMLDDPNNARTDYSSILAAPVAGNIISEVAPYLGIATDGEDRSQTTVIDDAKPDDLRHMKKDQLLDWAIKAQALLTEKPSSVIRCDKPPRNAEHPTMKPVVLCGRLIKNSSLPGQTVLDLFGGSGSTLIACEQLSRKCYTMEYDPRYVDVIVQRWEDFTGEKAVRLK